jgi:HNH endonuclease
VRSTHARLRWDLRRDTEVDFAYGAIAALVTLARWGLRSRPPREVASLPAPTSAPESKRRPVRTRRTCFDRPCAICGAIFWPKTTSQRSCSKACGRTFAAQLVTKPLEDRFWSKVDKSAGPNGCWLWTGSKTELGYGWIRRDGIAVKSSRVAWELANGKRIPEGMQACHRCDNPPCVNPEHIFVGSNEDNVADRIRKGRTAHKVPFQVVEALRADPSDARVRDAAATYGVSLPHARALASGRRKRAS